MSINPDNYGTHPACEKLYDAGIVLETDAHWYLRKHDNKWVCTLRTPQVTEYFECIPAPSPAEVWRELANYSIELIYRRILAVTEYELTIPEMFKLFLDLDSAISVLIWAKGEK